MEKVKPLTEEQKIEFWGHRMWEFHWIIVGVTTVMYLCPTIYCMINSFNPDHWWFYTWGLSFGLVFHLWTPMIIKYRKLWKKANPT